MKFVSFQTETDLCRLWMSC